MKILCVLNPRSAGGLALEQWPQVEALMRKFGIEYELLAGADAPIDHQVHDALQAAPVHAYAAIAGIGGDGTHSAAMNGIMAHAAANPGVPLPAYAFIPLGTGNDLAKSFGLRTRDERLPDDLHRAVATIVHGADYRLDLGFYAGRYFADALTIGLDSRVLRERNARKRRLDRIPLLRHMGRGRALYTLCALSPLIRRFRTQATIVVDGRTCYEGPVLNVVINNTRIYAGEFDFCLDAYADDGLLDVVVFTGQTDYLRKYLLGMRYNPERVRVWSEKLNSVGWHTQGRRVEVRLDRAEDAQMDGEELPQSERFEVTVAPGALRVKTPVGPA